MGFLAEGKYKKLSTAIEGVRGEARRSHAQHANSESGTDDQASGGAGQSSGTVDSSKAASSKSRRSVFRCS
jgi:hypothetical protein